MKIISKDGGLAAIIVASDEVVPLRGYHLQEMLSAVGKYYKFSRMPTPDEASKGGAKFDGGYYNDIFITQLTIHNDGVTITTKDTADSETVLSHLLGLLKTVFQFREPITVPKRYYQSDLVVEFENDPTETVSFLHPLFALLQNELVELGNVRPPFHLARMALGNDPEGTRYMEFAIERRVGMPWSANRFFCKAYMRTQTHIQALELLDELLGRKL